MEKKICKTCGKEKVLDEFAFNRSHTGMQYRRSECKECHRLVGKEHYRTHKVYYAKKQGLHRKEIMEWVKAYKRTHPCELCGQSHEAIITFHHTNRKDKAFGLDMTTVRSRSFGAVKREVLKCQVLCFNCHSILHYNERKRA